jgi:hypothetical protein
MLVNCTTRFSKTVLGNHFEKRAGQTIPTTTIKASNQMTNDDETSHNDNDKE